MNNTKINSYIGFSIKMNNVIFGLDLIKNSRKRPCIVLYDDSLGENSLKDLINHCNEKKIQLLKLENMLSDITKRKNLKVLGITNKSLAQAISVVAEVLND